jgi:acetyl esterase/lipase
MSASVISSYEIDVQDIEYLRHGDKPLLARVYKPRGTGPFPLILDVHGGAWCRGDRLDDAGMDEPLARSGVVVAALNFRMPPDAPYPGSLADINYAIRWFKGRAKQFGVRADRVGTMGISSGGQQVMLSAMRPRDARYSALPLSAAAPVDAGVRCVVLCWPVIDPLGRYRYAKKLKAGGKPYPDIVDNVLPAHDQYWQSEDAMSEGSPTRALERGEKMEMPPVLYIQGTSDLAHPRPDLERFVAGYRKAGGRVELQLIEGEGEAFIKKNPNSPNSLKAIDKIIEFVHQEMR